MNCTHCGTYLMEDTKADEMVSRWTTPFDPDTVRLWCPDCAVTDERVDSLDEILGEVHWEAR